MTVIIYPPILLPGMSVIKEGDSREKARPRVENRQTICLLKRSSGMFTRRGPHWHRSSSCSDTEIVTHLAVDLLCLNVVENIVRIGANADLEWICCHYLFFFVCFVPLFFLSSAQAHIVRVWVDLHMCIRALWVGAGALLGSWLSLWRPSSSLSAARSRSRGGPASALFFLFYFHRASRIFTLMFTVSHWHRWAQLRGNSGSLPLL